MFSVVGAFPSEQTLTCSTRGRYVIIQISGSAILTLCEVEVFGDGKVNILSLVYFLIWLFVHTENNCVRKSIAFKFPINSSHKNHFGNNKTQVT